MFDTTNTKATVELALNRNGYRNVKFLSARLVKRNPVEDVHEMTYYNDEGELETGLVYVERSTGKAEF